ncbi:uncharacterized protein EV420DRAFT_1767675 [Desarmillaria tabescens]|uniref:Uncharacterized protein n=1 Tax=Armillaria tabescens TaxID=1929756 RepID=A0AA39JQS2_ARMTA|nr:uncharacterized protein EV420DRAFT_1767675 [Desarmillaria tabescens]KAK0447029.1 hypothetical protein EV420DRAFT_1767675 [Desarmillaria tabescens]
MIIEPSTSPISLLSHRIRDRFVASEGWKLIAPIMSFDQSAHDKVGPEMSSFLANEYPPIVSVHTNDKYRFCSPVINIRIDNCFSTAVSEQSATPGLEFFAVCEADAGYRLETAFFGGIMGVAFRNGTAQDPQLPDIAYFILRSPAGKVYKIDIERAAAWITATEGTISPFDLDRLEELCMDGQDFLMHTCAFVNAACAPVNIQPRRHRNASYRANGLIILP